MFGSPRARNRSLFLEAVLLAFICISEFSVLPYIYILFSFLGVLIDFISVPVTVGFTSATSVIIAVSQLKGLLGLQFKSGAFIDTVKKVFSVTSISI